MNTPMITFTATICMTSLAFAAQMHRLPSGLELQAPASWQVQVNGQAANIVPAGHDPNLEAYIAGVMTEQVDIQDTGRLPGLIAQYFPALAQIRIAGPPTPFTAAGGRGIVHSYNASSGFTPMRISLYMVDLPGKAVAVLVGVGRKDVILRRNLDLIELASTFNASVTTTQHKPAALPTISSSAVVRTWMLRLNDKKLVRFAGYNSGGGGGGMSSEKYLFLASDGSYAFRSSSSVSIYVPGANGSSAGRNADGGRWRVVEGSGHALLELNSRNGETERIQLSAKGSETYLNGRRWYVVGINE
jgi:hypothetical protein